jgi:hypothetical protein
MRLRHQIKVGYLDLMQRANSRTMRDANSAASYEPHTRRFSEFPDKDRSCLTDAMQLDLFSTPARERQLEVAIDELAERFGTNVVRCANDLNNPRPVATLDFLDDRILDWFLAMSAMGH